jgi:transposase
MTLAVQCPSVPSPVAGAAKPVPFASQYVTLTRQEHIRLVSEANSWKSLHGRAVERAKWRESRYQRVLRQLKVEAAQREAGLRAELEQANAKVRNLQQRLFGRKSERRHGGSEQQAQGAIARAPRGHRRGAPGHGRTTLPHLPQRVEVVGLDEPECPQCGAPLEDFPGTEDCEVLEVEVQAYRRVIRRRRYRPVCGCGCVPGIVTAPPPNRLIERGKFGVSVWVSVLLDKYLYGRPSHRLLLDLADHGLDMSPGTLAGGLQAIAPLFEPLEQAFVAKLRSEPHWHADETRWAVFVIIEGKAGHRWYLWVFHSRSVIHYVLDESRSAEVVEGELAGVVRGIISCDRYSAYKKFARLNPGVLLAFCWAHQRRDFLELANAYPDLSRWAMGWVDIIGALYHLNALRLQAAEGSAERAVHQVALRQAVQAMADERDAQLAKPELAVPAVKVLQSMKNHWSGLTVFVEHAWVPMDNSAAERAMRTPAVCRKNYYGSGCLWSGQLAAMMYSLLMTARLWKLNARTWLSAYLQACADNGNRAPPDIEAFLPWTMDEARLAAMRAHRPAERKPTEDLDTS